MPDLSGDGYNLPNPYGLLASDFGYDVDGYRIALAFLSDLSGGTDEKVALTQNGGETAMLRGWEGNNKFRRVLQKCRKAAKADQGVEPQKVATLEDLLPPPGQQRFIPLSDIAPHMIRSFRSGL